MNEALKALRPQITIAAAVDQIGFTAAAIYINIRKYMFRRLRFLISQKKH